MESEGIPADASSLIYLAKATAFTEAHRCVGTLLGVPAVWKESVEAGRRIGASDVPAIEAALASRSLRRVDLDHGTRRLAGRLAAEHNLGSGESQVLAFASDRSARALVNEGRATRVARALGVRSFSTLFIPLLGVRAGRLERSEGVAMLRRLAVAATASADVVFQIETAIDEVRSDY